MKGPKMQQDKIYKSTRAIVMLAFYILSAFWVKPVFATAVTDSTLRIKEEDGSPSKTPHTVKVTNGTLTDNGDGTVSLNTGGGSGSPGGSDTQVQFNDSSSFGGDAGMVFDKTGNVLTVSGDIIVGTQSVCQEDGTNCPAAGAGDVTAWGDCASGACGSGAAGGGTTFALYDGDSNKGTFVTANLNADRIYTFGNLALTFDQSVASGGTPTFTGTNITAVASGDSATAFFSAGTIEHERGGLEADVSAYDGFPFITGGATTSVSGTTTQIPIFDGSGAPTVAALSGHATMTNAGVVTVSDVTCTNCLTNTEVASADSATAADTVVVVDGTDATSFPAIFDSATGTLAVKTDGGLTYAADTGTLSSTVLTEGANAVFNSSETPGGELGGTWASPTIDDSITVTGWVMGASTATTPSTDDNDTSLATTAFVQTEFAYREFDLMPAGMILDDTAPPDLTIVESTGTGTSRRLVADFDPTTDQFGYWTFVAPSDTTTGDILLDVKWFTNDTGANEDAIWYAQISCTTEGDADSMAEDAVGTANTAAENCNATEANRLISTTITLSNTDSIAAGDSCTLVLGRDADDSIGDADNDGLSSDARFVAVHVKIPRI